MACSINLRSDALDGADGGGTWTYIGYNATNENGPYSAPPNIVLPAGDDPLFDSTGLPNGFYKFEYALPGCGSTETIIEIIDGPNAGTSNDIQICIEDDTVVNVFNEIGVHDSGGIWTVSPFPPAGAWNSSTGNFNTALIGIAQTYTFTYFVNSQIDATFDIHNDTNCQDCNGQSTVTVDIVQCCLCAGVGANCRIADLEGHDYIINEVQGKGRSIRIQVSSILVTGTEFLSAPVFTDITPTNLNVINFGGNPYVANIVFWLNQLTLNNNPSIPLNFSTGGQANVNGECNTIKMRYPECLDVRITFDCFAENEVGPGYSITHGGSLTNTGLTFVTYPSNGQCNQVFVPSSVGCNTVSTNVKRRTGVDDCSTSPFCPEANL